MPFRRAQPPPDLERVARILGGGAADQDPASDLDAGKPGESSARKAGGWLPDPPEIHPSVARPGRPSRSAVEGMRSRLTCGDRARASTDAPRAAAAGGRSALDLLDADLRRARRPGFVTAPEPLTVGRWAVSNGTVVALIALVVAVGCVLAVRVLWAERSAGAGAASSERANPVSRVVVTGADGVTAPALVPSGGSSGAATGGNSPGGPAAGGRAAGSGAAVSRAATASGEATASGAATAGAMEVVVHVVGQVVRPGLVRLRPGARVADAVAAAGGAGPNADLGVLNLARLVVDGEQLQVPKPGQVVAAPSAPGSGPAPSGRAGPGAVAGGSGAALVSLNSADLAALDTLPGVGPVLAQRIIDWRTEHGRFTAIDELGEVSGIGEKLLAQLGTRVVL